MRLVLFDRHVPTAEGVAGDEPECVQAERSGDNLCIDRLGRLAGEQEEWRLPTVCVEGGPKVDDVLRAVVAMHVAPRVGPATGLVQKAQRVEDDYARDAPFDRTGERKQLL